MRGRRRRVQTEVSNLPLKFRNIGIRHLHMQMRADHHGRERDSPYRSRHGVDNVDERRGSPLAEQLDDDHGTDEDANEHNHDPCRLLFIAKCRLEDVSVEKEPEEFSEQNLQK